MESVSEVCRCRNARSASGRSMTAGQLRQAEASARARRSLAHEIRAERDVRAARRAQAIAEASLAGGRARRGPEAVTQGAQRTAAVTERDRAEAGGIRTLSVDGKAPHRVVETRAAGTESARRSSVAVLTRSPQLAGFSFVTEACGTLCGTVGAGSSRRARCSEGFVISRPPRPSPRRRRAIRSADD